MAIHSLFALEGRGLGGLGRAKSSPDKGCIRNACCCVYMNLQHDYGEECWDGLGSHRIELELQVVRGGTGTQVYDWLKQGMFR